MISRLALMAALGVASFWAVASAQTDVQRGDAESARGAPLLLERNARFEAPRFEPGQEVPVVQMSWRERDPQEVIADVGAARAVMLQGAELEGLDAELREALYGDDAGNWSRVPGAPQLLVKYEGRFDEFRLMNEELDIMREPVGRMDLEEARKRADEVLAQLLERGVEDRALYRNAAVQVGYRRVGQGTTDRSTDDGQIVEYRFTFRPRIEGIELANAGIRLGVLLDGSVSSMRVGGVTPEGRYEEDKWVPGERGEFRRIEASPGQLMTRFYRSLPPNAEPVIAWSRVMYVMPEDERSALVEPRLVVSFTERQRTSDGQRVSSRRRVLGFSLLDPEAGVVDFTEPGEILPDDTTRPE